jgi:DNA helicase-2/ATP-dependent DNA helicase PcrA
MVSYLLFAYNPKNTTAFSRIVNVPRRGIGDVWMKRILECNRDAPGDSMLDTLKKIVKRQSPIQFTFGIITKLKDFINIVGNIRSMIEAKVKNTSFFFSFLIILY